MMNLEASVTARFQKGCLVVTELSLRPSPHLSIS